MLVKILISLLLSVSCSALLAGPPNNQMTGAYSDSDVTNQGVLDAADFAVKQMKSGTLVKIISAQTQVVAGTNYSLMLEIETKDGSHHTYKAVVYVPLPVAQLPMQLKKFQDMGVIKNNN